MSDELGYTRHPVYGPRGETYHVIGYYGHFTFEVWCWTREEAWTRRDEFYCAGCEQVRIEGLPGIYD